MIDKITIIFFAACAVYLSFAGLKVYHSFQPDRPEKSSFEVAAR